MNDRSDQLLIFINELRTYIQDLVAVNTSLLNRIEKLENIVTGKHTFIPSLCGICNAQLLQGGGHVYCLNC